MAWTSSLCAGLTFSFSGISRLLPGTKPSYWCFRLVSSNSPVNQSINTRITLTENFLKYYLNFSQVVRAFFSSYSRTISERSSLNSVAISSKNEKKIVYSSLNFIGTSTGNNSLYFTLTSYSSEFENIRMSDVAYYLSTENEYKLSCAFIRMWDVE